MREVVVVHGLWYRSWSTALLARRLRTAGHRAHPFSYPTLSRDPEDSAGALEAHCRRLGTETVHFVGHSLGGLLILAMLRRGGVHAGRVVFLGTPLNGSVVARRLRRTRTGSSLLGQAGELLATGVAGPPEAVDCGMVAGTAGRGLGRLTGPFEGPADGTVAVAETRAEWLADRCELAVGHTGLLFSAEVARQAACFIENGRFNH